jgi:hypothetical protein
VDDFTTSSTWSSNNNPVAQVGASTGVVTGEQAGSLEIGAEYPLLVVVTGVICSAGAPVPCPVSIMGAAAPGNVDNATISGPVQTVDGSTTPSFSVSTTGPDTPTSYAWSFTAPSGAGNSPNVNFNPNNQASTTTDAHWFALPNDTCKASTSAVYTIIATVTFPSLQIAPQTTLTVILLATAGYENEALVSGYPSIAQNLQGTWVVTGQGSLSRVVASPVVVYATTSQFYNKVYAHENEHYVQWTSGMNSDLYVVANLMTVLSPLTGTTQADLQNEISSAWNTWTGNQHSTYVSRLPAAEADAYQVSDPISPQYIYQSSCGAKGL